MDAGVGAGLMMFLVILGFVIAVLWVFLPFAVFGVKDLIREGIRQQQRTNELLQSVIDLAKERNAAERPGSASGRPNGETV